ncbi:MAG: histidinol-phosphate transaminase [Candidatus Caldatribacteriota bacterium]
MSYKDNCNYAWEKIFLTNSYLKFPLPAELLKELAEELNEINRYPSGGEYTELRKVLANYTGVKADNILPANGSDEVIEMITRAYPGKVLIPIPTFSQYEVSADRSKLPKILVPSLQDKEYNLHYSSSQLKEASLVWICNPNNPTGTGISQEKILEILNKAKGMVAIDECNYEYFGESAIGLIEKYKNLIIVRSFSKNFGLAGLRLGFAISNAENIKKISAYGQCFRVNRLAEKAAGKVLKYLDYYQELWDRIRKIRTDFSQKINKLGWFVYPSQANFILLEAQNKEESKAIWRYLKENNIYTLPGWKEEFSGLEDRFIRFTVGEEWEMNITIEVLSEYRQRCRRGDLNPHRHTPTTP